MFCAPAYPEEMAKDILPLWREFMEGAPDEVSGLAEFSTVPQGPDLPENICGRRFVALATVYDGPAEDGERITMPLRRLAEPLIDFSGTMPCSTLQTAYDALFPKGRDRCYWKSTYLKSLDDNVIAAVTDGLARRPSEMTFASIWKFGGAFSRVAADATAFGDRSMPYMLSLDAIWSSASEDAANQSWVRGMWQAMQAHSTGRMYLNFPASARVRGR